MSKLKVTVLMGGTSTEREISLWTGRQILEALSPEKYTVVALDTAKPQTFVSLLDQQNRPDVVFIALHGPGGEDGTIQGMLELMKLPYTGSRVLASALAMDKAMTKRVLVAGGVSMPADITLYGPDDPMRLELASIALPVVIKPNTQGSTIGMTIVRDLFDLEPALEKAFELDHIVIIEQFVEGIEISVPVLGNEDLEVLPSVEIHRRRN
jgi:D-alanine-D-alanine ligase